MLNYPVRQRHELHTCSSTSRALLVIARYAACLARRTKIGDQKVLTLGNTEHHQEQPGPSYMCKCSTPSPL